jgi:hypothetical protein
MILIYIFDFQHFHKKSQSINKTCLSNFYILALVRLYNLHK